MTMAAAGTFDAKRAQAKDLYDEGFSCNAIARKLDVSPSTISRWAKAEGLTFDRAQTAMAVRAHTVDMQADRLLLAQKMIVNASDTLDMLEGEFLVYSFGGKENDFNSHVLDAAPIEARRSAQVIAGVAFDKATKVLEKSNEGMGRAESLVDHLEQFFDQLPDEPAADDRE
jgi:predicted transcriptional regulator